MDISPFVNNAALLLVLSVLSSYLRNRWVKEFRIKELLLGVLYGLFTIIAMSIPMNFTPGVIFDGRSIILGIAGLFESPLIVLCAVVLGSAYRIKLGGMGAFTGVGSIIISAAVGMLFKWLVSEKKIRLNPWTLYGFGFVIHLLLIFWFFTFPYDLALKIIKSIAFPYLGIFSITTMLMGLFILNQKQRLIAEKNLVLSEKKYRDLVNTMLEGIWVVDQDAVTTYVNPAMAKMLGYSVEEMIGKPIIAFIKKGLQKRYQQFFDRRKQGLFDRYDFECLHKDGNTIPVSVASTPLYDEKGSFAGSLAALQDITDRKHAEQLQKLQSIHLEKVVDERTRELNEAQIQLIQAERMATLGELAGSVGHELRNPLSIIRNAIYILKTIKKDDPRQEEYINLAEQEVQNASTIITDLLDYSRIQPSKPVPCDAFDIVSMVLDEKRFSENIKLSVSVSRDLPKILVNPQQIRKILENLVLNAIDAMPQGGNLEITAKKEKESISITISDTGSGISRENLKKLFTPLFTTKSHRVGLGLSLSKRLADINNADIRVKSQINKGTAFTLILPISHSISG